MCDPDLTIASFGTPTESISFSAVFSAPSELEALCDNGPDRKLTLNVDCLLDCGGFGAQTTEEGRALAVAVEMSHCCGSRSKLCHH